MLCKISQGICKFPHKMPARIARTARLYMFYKKRQASDSTFCNTSREAMLG